MFSNNNNMLNYDGRTMLDVFREMEYVNMKKDRLPHFLGFGQ